MKCARGAQVAAAQHQHLNGGSRIEAQALTELDKVVAWARVLWPPGLRKLSGRMEREGLGQVKVPQRPGANE